MGAHLRQEEAGAGDTEWWQDMKQHAPRQPEHPQKAARFPKGPTGTGGLNHGGPSHPEHVQDPRHPQDAGQGPSLHSSPAVDARSPQFRLPGMELGEQCFISESPLRAPSTGGR